MTREEMKLKLETVLTPKRFIHSLNVMDTAIKLANSYSIDEETAGIAGLLHDCARNLRGKEVFELCERFGIKPDYIASAQPELLHGPLGYYLAAEEYGVSSDEIREAIKYHTTGNENMSLLSKIVFMADYIEPDRNLPGIEEIRKEVYINIDLSMLMALDKTINYVIKRGAYIHPDTINARNSIIRDLGKVPGTNIKIVMFYGKSRGLL